MHNNYWNWGMGWGMWLIPFAGVLIIVFVWRKRLKSRKPSKYNFVNKNESIS